LLEGLDGVQKMSKSLGNYIGIDEAPTEMFGKLMSISDDLMWRYFDLLSFRSSEEIEALKERVAGGENPRDIKFLLGEEIVARFHSDEAAVQAREAFIARFRKGQMPDEIAEKEVRASGEGIAIANLLKDAGLTQSTSDAMRMIRQGAVKMEGERIEDTKRIFAAGTVAIFQVGKRRFARISILEK